MRSITIAALAVAIALVTAIPAAAHVTAQPPEQVAGGFTTVTFRVPNEREEATNAIKVQFPESIMSARVMPVPGWDYKVNMVDLDEPVKDSHGEEVTERIDTIEWTGGEIKDGEFQEFTVSVKMPEEGELGDLLFFPTTQSYEGGESVSWIEKPESADDEAELENPAPNVTLVAGDAHGAAASDDAGDDDHGDEGAADEDEETDDTAALTVLSVSALVIALLALLLGWKHAKRKDN